MSEHKKPAEEKVEFDWLSKENIKKILLIALAIILMLVFFQKIGKVLVVLHKGWEIIFPFVLGACLAFVVNVPMNQIENGLLGKKKFKGKRPLAWFITFILILGIIAAVMALVVPRIVDTAKVIAVDVQNLGSLSDIQAWVIAKFPQTESWFSKVDVSYKALVQKAMSWVAKSGTTLMNSGIGVVSSVVSGLATFLIGFAFSIYVLFQKEKLAVQGKKVLYALFPDHVNEKILKVCSLSYKTFSNFIRGQFLEACILGFMFLITMSIFRFPYALLCSVFITVTALIPIFGAFLGGGLSTLLILIDSPRKALFFIILFLVLQQIEGKLIYPHVVGGSVGLPSIWVLFAITTGGQLMGVAGMLIFVPLCSVLYALFREFVYNRLEERKVPSEKWALNPPKAAHGDPVKPSEALESMKEKQRQLKAKAEQKREKARAAETATEEKVDVVGEKLEEAATEFEEKAKELEEKLKK